jgi:hypothetical protein
MATEASKRRKKRITVKPNKPPNPLFEKWLEEWKAEAANKGSDMQYCFGRALSSLRKYPLPLATGRDCGILDHFGNRLCIMLDRRLAEYRKAHPEGWIHYLLFNFSFHVLVSVVANGFFWYTGDVVLGHV